MDICRILGMETNLYRFAQGFIFYDSIGNYNVAKDFKELADSTIEDLKTVARGADSELRADILSNIQNYENIREIIGMCGGYQE